MKLKKNLFLLKILFFEWNTWYEKQVFFHKKIIISHYFVCNRRKKKNNNSEKIIKNFYNKNINFIFIQYIWTQT